LLPEKIREFCEIYSQPNKLQWIFRHHFLENLFIDSSAVIRLENSLGPNETEESIFSKALQAKVLKNPSRLSSEEWDRQCPGGIDMGFFTTADDIWNLFNENRAWVIRVISRAILSSRAMNTTAVAAADDDFAITGGKGKLIRVPNQGSGFESFEYNAKQFFLNPASSKKIEILWKRYKGVEQGGKVVRFTGFKPSKTFATTDEKQFFKTFIKKASAGRYFLDVP
jgi:hypothetical protein